jgi:hypothetical protein
MIMLVLPQAYHFGPYEHEKGPVEYIEIISWCRLLEQELQWSDIFHKNFDNPPPEYCFDPPILLKLQ